MVQNAALVTNPNRDSPENGGTQGPYAYGVVWMRSIINALAFRGARQVLEGDVAVGSKFEDAARSMDPSIVVGFGHGASDMWVGQYIEAEGYSILLTPANADLMVGRVIYLLSCYTAQELGPEIVRSGAIAYAGYNQAFTWVGSDTSSPATDLQAAPFGRAATAYPRELVRGKTVKEAKDKAIEVFNQEIERWEQSDDIYAREVVKWLLWDRDAFTVLGDETAVGFIPRTPTVLIVAGAIAAAAAAYGIYRWRKRR